jgi:hypothetical protein
METKQRIRIRWLNRTLAVLLGLAMVWTLVAIANALWGSDFRIGFFTVKGLKILTDKELSFHERAIVVGLVSAPDFCWLAGLTQLARLSAVFGRGEIFTAAVIRRMLGFGWALIAMAVAEVSAIPAVACYLVWHGRMDPLEKPLRLLYHTEAINDLLAGVLVLIFVCILGAAIEINEDARLTI